MFFKCKENYYKNNYISTYTSQLFAMATNYGVAMTLCGTHIYIYVYIYIYIYSCNKIVKPVI